MLWVKKTEIPTNVKTAIIFFYMQQDSNNVATVRPVASGLRLKSFATLMASPEPKNAPDSASNTSCDSSTLPRYEFNDTVNDFFIKLSHLQKKIAQLGLNEFEGTVNNFVRHKPLPF